MANIGNDVKTFFLKGMEALGKAAGSITETAQKKLGEMNVAARRDEIRKALPDVMLQMWRSGAELPHELVSLLAELADLEEQLAAMRVKPEPEKPEEEAAAEEPETSFEEAAEILGDKVEAAVDAAGEFVEGKLEQAGEAIETMVDSLRRDDGEDGGNG